MATAAPAPSGSVARAELERSTVLLVEGEPKLAATIVAALKARGGEVWHARTGADAKVLVRRARPRLIVLNLILPDVDGLVLMGDLTALEPAAVIILSPSQQRRDVVLGLRLGADDVISPPLDMDEFLARVQAVLRRVDRRLEQPEVAAPSGRPEAHVGLDTIVLDRRRGRATVAGRALALTPIEFRLLAALVDHAEYYVPREELIEAAWGHPHPGGSRALDAHVARLRGKLRAASGPATSIEAVRLPGYRLVVAGQGGVDHQPSAPLDLDMVLPRRSVAPQLRSASCVTGCESGAPDPATNR